MDPQKLIILGIPVRTAGRTCFDLSGSASYRQICDKGILGLAGSVGDHRAISRMLGHLHCIQGFREGSDLIYLDEDGIGNFKLNTAAQTFDIGDKQIISHKLDLFSQMFRQVFPAFPVILPEPILNGNNGKLDRKSVV